MFDPTIDTTVFLSCAFVLGLMLGWVLWRHGAARQLTGAATESEFWQQRLNQARQERDIDQKKIEALEKEYEVLKTRLEAN